VVAILLVVASLLGGALFTMLFGLVQGEEFSPNDFRRRRFYYYEIPLIGVQISPVVHEPVTNSLAAYLRRRRLIPTAPAGQRWDVVYRASISQSARHGSADNLCAYLDLPGENGKSRWLDWTRSHSDLAKELWPVVAKMARERIYFAIPQMMEKAERATSAELLRAELQSLATQAQNIAQPQAQSAGSS
jgi:hypothetical protein